MAIDRDAVLRRTEALIRQGKLDAAIAEYVRLVEQQPHDWVSVNALGDLYVRVGDTARAIAQFSRMADHLYDEGFLPKAAALYKKSLRLRSTDEHTLLRLADIAARQHLLADARMHLRQLAAQRRARDDQRGVHECLVRLGSLEDADVDARLAAARAAGALDDLPRAAAFFRAAAEALAGQRRTADAIGALAEGVQTSPGDPDLLLALGRMELDAGHETEAFGAFTRLIALAPERDAELMTVAREMAAAGAAGRAYGCVEIVTDAALLASDWNRAVGALRTFLANGPHIPALARLADIAGDAGLDDLMRETQVQLADAYLDAGMAPEARVVVERLVAHDPRSEAYVQRLRQVLDVLGVPGVAEMLARYLDEAPLAPAPAPSAPRPPSAALSAEDAEPGEQARPVGGDDPAAEGLEIDLSDALAALSATPAPLAPEVPPEDPEGLHDLLETMRVGQTQEPEAEGALAAYEQGMAHLREGRADEAAVHLEAAARAPATEFQAAAQLGRLHVSRGELEAAIEWLERAAETPATSPDEGFAVFLDLADALERMGEDERALAVLIELQSNAGAYGDAAVRIGRLIGRRSEDRDT